MSQDRTKMNATKLAQCPHINSGHHVTNLDINKLEKFQIKKTCESCKYAGPNLWICLQRNCLRVGCSEQANDHSTEHFKRNNSHCVHFNMSSQRAWCYLCEREVFLDLQRLSTHIHDAFRSALKTADLSTDEADDIDDGENSQRVTTGLVGLQNIANTCYMNSALSALSNLPAMTHYFLNCGDLVEHTLEQSAHRCKAGLAKSYQRLMQDIWCKRVGIKDYITPRGILYGIRSVHPMFRGFQQHDTQEFLRCFMDQLHEELKEQRATAPSVCGHRPQRSTHNNGDDNRDENVHSASSTPSQSYSLSDDTEYETCDSSVSEESNLLFENQSQIRGNGDAGRSHKPVLNGSKIAGVSVSQSQSQQAPMRSIISDVFDGKLLSSVQCLTCDRISTREETFQDLSLPIPHRDYLNVLHHTQSISAQSLNSIDSSTSSHSSDSWFSWVWQLLRSWLWGPSVTLYDCMSSFFSADELKGDNMYSCEKCNKLRTGVKFSRILDLPEVLCIHLKRFRHDLSYSSKISSHVHYPLENFDMRPYLHIDCTSHISLYNLASVICHHGTVGGGHYTCFARNALTNRWYEFDDQNVTEVLPDVVQNCQAYVLFYHKYNPQMEHIRAEASELSASNPVHMADIRFYIAREWLSRFSTFAEPGPINNWAMLCPHGGILQSKLALLSQIAVPISQPLWDFLYRKFGGGPAINMLFECEVCKRVAEALARRQHYELAVFTKYNGLDADVDSSAIFAISMPWLRKWQQFARGNTRKEPGPIANANIATSGDVTQTSSSPIRNVRTGSDYAQLNAPLWRFLHGIYGGGPEIIIRGSLTEEIEIIDQDEYDTDNCRRNPDVSDTESNIGQRNTPDFNTNETTKSIIRPSSNLVDENPHILWSLYPENSKHSKQIAASNKKSKTLALRTTLRKKSKKNRNALKNSEMFGAKGNYSQQSCCNAMEESKEIQKLTLHSTENNEVKRSAFKTSSNQSFQSETQPLKNISSDNMENRTNLIGHSRSGHIKSKTKRKNAVSLQKFTHMRASNESIETDV